MIRVNTVLSALAWVFDNADDEGYPLTAAVDAYRLTDEENDAMRDMHAVLHVACQVSAMAPSAPDDRTDIETDDDGSTP
jgi:hypothetical protein